MSIVRFGPCATCRTPLLWLRSWGFGEPRPLEADPAGPVVIDAQEARHRWLLPGEVAPPERRYRPHWPCPSARRHGRALVPRTPAARLPIEVAVVPHTHWDREWYATFDAFRVRLAETVDGVLDLLDADPAYAAFTLDGQTAMIDDYLAARPEAEPRVRRLAAAGRLATGPFEILADEFLVSGETLARNLQRGVRRATDLGGLLRAGYMPDQFGHTAQLPQLLRLAGLEHACLFRGVPDTVASTAFWWEAPDGSRVRTENLTGGYCNAFRFTDDPKLLAARAADLETALGPARAGDLLLMNGCDHQPVQPWVAATVTAANDMQRRYHFAVTRLDDHLESQPAAGLPTWRGELRDSGGSTVTPGVVSNRVDVRLATAAAERAVEARAEPLCALFLPPADWPEALLDRAWGLLVANAAHDSVCGCSADPVVREVLVRADSAQAIGDGLAAHALRAVGAAVEGAGTVVVNAGAAPRRSPVELQWRGDGPWHATTAGGRPLPTQVVRVDDDVELDVRLPCGDSRPVLDLFGPDRFAGHPVDAWEARVDGDELTVALRVAGSVAAARATGAAGPAHDRVAAWVTARPAGTVRVVLRHPSTQVALAMTPEVAGFGWSTLRVAAGTGPTTAVAAGDTWIANEHLRVEPAADGSLDVVSVDGTRLHGLARLVDGGDAGDTYNWSPPSDDVVVEAPESVAADVVERGPVRARLVVTRTYRWPDRVERTVAGSRQAGAAVPVTVRTVADVVTGEPFVRLTIELDNRVRDHRLRAHFPLARPVEGSHAGAAFAVVHRALHTHGSPVEAPLATYPAQGFVDCSDGRGGLAVATDSVTEYEVVDGGSELAVTLLRAVGDMSRPDGSMRPAPAGPVRATPDAQVPGPLVRRFALVPHAGGWQDAPIAAAVAALAGPLDTVEAAGGGRLAPDGWRLRVEGASVTALTRRDGELELRAVRLSDEPGSLRVAAPAGALAGRLVDLRGRDAGPFAGSMPVGPWQIVTLRLPDPEPA